MSKESHAVIAKDLAVAVIQSGKFSFSARDVKEYGEKVAEVNDIKLRMESSRP